MAFDEACQSYTDAPKLVGPSGKAPNRPIWHHATCHSRNYGKLTYQGLELKRERRSKTEMDVGKLQVRGNIAMANWCIGGPCLRPIVQICLNSGLPPHALPFLRHQ